MGYSGFSIMEFDGSDTDEPGGPINKPPIPEGCSGEWISDERDQQCERLERALAASRSQEAAWKLKASKTSDPAERAEFTRLAKNARMTGDNVAELIEKCCHSHV